MPFVFVYRQLQTKRCDTSIIIHPVIDSVTAKPQSTLYSTITKFHTSSIPSLSLYIYVFKDAVAFRRRVLKKDFFEGERLPSTYTPIYRK